jgi:predicted nucleotidyltransferase
MAPTDFSALRRRVLSVIEADLAREAEQAEVVRRSVLPRLAEGLISARRAGRCGRAWLFGSFAWGKPSEHSDIDVLAADCADPDELAAELWRHTERAVHVVALETAPETLRRRVLDEGQPL